MNSQIAVAVGLAAILAALLAPVSTFTPAFAATINADITPGSSSKTTDAMTPNPINANVGDTVTWINKDSTPHTITSGTGGQPDGKFDSSPGFSTLMAPQQTFSHTFTEAGEFPYYCGLHVNMVGTVIVAGSGPGPEPEPEQDITLQLNKESFQSGDTVMLEGIVSNYTRQYITLTVTNPDGYTYRVDQFKANSDGSFDYSFVLNGEKAVAGQWRLALNVGNIESIHQFQLASDLLPLQVSEIFLQDIKGNPLQAPVSVGSRVMLTFDTTNTGNFAMNYVVIIQVSSAADDTIVYLTWQTGRLNPDDTTSSGFAWEPTDEGSYIAKAFLWSSLDHPTPLSDPAETTIRANLVPEIASTQNEDQP